MAKHITVNHRIGPMTSRRSIKDQDKEYHYHYARNDADRIQDLVEVYGYEVVLEDGTTSKDGSLVGAKTAGGDVLMRMPIAKWNERKKEKALAARAQLEGPFKTFEDQGMKNNVKTHNETKMTRDPSRTN